MSDSMERCVARGADLFDRVRPGWARLIDPRTLNLWSTKACPGAQVFGSYDAAVKMLRLRHFEDHVAYGLDLSDGEPNHAYEILTKLWLIEIARRIR